MTGQRATQLLYVLRLESAAVSSYSSLIPQEPGLLKGWTSLGVNNRTQTLEVSQGRKS